MRPSRSRVTTQGQVSVPADVRRRLGIAPGAVIEWEVEGNHAIVRRAGRHAFADIHERLFRRTPRRRSVEEMDEAIRAAVRKRHARR